MRSLHCVSVVFALLIVFLAATASSAALSERDLLTAGDNYITFDSATGLEWLDLTLTDGLSYNSVVAGSYVSEYGFRVATFSEVSSLFASVGLATNYYAWQYGETYQNALMLSEYFGYTLVSGSQYFSEGKTVSTGGSGPGGPWTNKIRIVTQSDAQNTYITNGYSYLDFGYSEAGTYLVRTTVAPEPLSTTLFLIGGAVLGLRRFRKK